MREIHRGPRPRLRREWILRGWSLKDAADELCQVAAELNAGPLGVDGNAVGRWERGASSPYPRYVQLLCALYGRTPDALDLVDALSEPRPLTPPILVDVKRRDFIQYLTTLGGATQIDSDRAASALGGVTRLDERLLDDLEAVTTSLVDDYWTASPASVVPAVEGHLGGLRSLLASQAVGTPGRRLRRIASDTAARAGWLAFRLENRLDVHAHWAFAAALAEEAGDGPLRAHTLISRSNLHSATWRDGDGGDADTAIALLEAAEAAAGSLVLLSYVRGSMHGRRRSMQ
jgi:transcriptional regulator with XRE-family HTH domain